MASQSYRRIIGAHLILTAVLAAGAPAVALADHGWYGSLGAGVSFLTDQDISITEPGLQPSPASLSHDAGFSGAATIGRYIGGADGEVPRWRAELELLGFGTDRDKFEGGDTASLRGTVRGYGGFANVLYRVWDRNDMRVWLGGGVGYMSVRLPDDRGSVENCDCLGPDRNSDVSWRVKLIGEKQISEHNSAFVEVGYVDLPGGRSSSGTPTRYSDFGLVNIHVGLRRDF